MGVLRAADGHDASGSQPGLAELAGRASSVSEAEMEVSVEGDRLEVPASADLSTYRIVQETLTDCLKHSGASQATVTERYRPEDFAVEVVDNGVNSSESRARAHGGGRGHLGMRERVALFG